MKKLSGKRYFQWLGGLHSRLYGRYGRRVERNTVHWPEWARKAYDDGFYQG